MKSLKKKKNLGRFYQNTENHGIRQQFLITSVDTETIFLVIIKTTIMESSLSAVKDLTSISFIIVGLGGRNRSTILGSDCVLS